MTVSLITHLLAAAVGAALAWVLAKRIGAKAAARPQTEGEHAQRHREARERLELVSEFAGVGIWDWNLLTDQLTSVFAQQGEIEDPKAFVRKLVHPDDHAGFEAAIRQAIKLKQPLEHQYRTLNTDGSIHYRQFNARVYCDADGKPTRMLGVSVDTTRLKDAALKVDQQARELRELIERFNLAANAAGIAVWEWKTGQRVVRTDARMANPALYGQCADELDPAQFLNETLHPDDREDFLRTVQTAFGTADHLSQRYRVFRPDGGIAHLQFNARIFRDSRNMPTRLLGVSFDVTEQALAAEKLAQQTQHERDLLRRLNLATKAAGIAIWDWDLGADRFTADSFIARAFGSTKLDIPSGAREFLLSTVHDDDRAGFHELIERALAEASSISFRYRSVILGEVHHLQLHGHVERDAEGKALRVMGVTMDVTAEVERTRELQQRAEYERELRDQLNLATQAAGIGIWYMDVETGQISSDAKLRALLGADSEIKKFHGVHPDDRDYVRRVMTRALESKDERGSSLRHRVVLPDGQLTHLQTHIRIFRDPDGRAHKVLGVSWDVTDQIEHAEQLRQQAAHVQRLADRLSVATHAAGLSAWEMDVPTHKLTWVGNRVSAFGLDHVPLEEYGPAMLRLIPPEDQEALRFELYEALTKGQQTFSSRFRLVREDGTTRHMRTYSHVVRDESGNPLRILGATTDITNEVQTTELLQRQAEQERALIDRLSVATEAAGISSWEIDLRAGKFLWVENPLAGMTDSNPEGALERHAARVHPDDRQTFFDAIREAHRNKSNRISYRYRAYRDDGSMVHLQVHARLLKDESGRTVRVLGVTWDATKEVEAAEKLELQARHERELLDRLSMANEAAGIASWEVDMDQNRFTLAEQAILKLHGVSEFSGRTDEFFAHIHPDDRNVFMDSVRATLKARRDRFSCRYRTPKPDGTMIHIQTRARLVFDADGRARRLIGVSWDITKEIEAAERLRQQAEMLRVAERRLERASLSSSEGHWESDLVGRVWYSSSYHTLLGYADGEMSTRSNEAFDLYVHPDDRDNGRQRMRDHIVTGVPFGCDLRLRMKTGEYRWFRQRGTAERNADGHAILMSGSIQDIHEQKQTEDALKLAQERFERAIKGTQDGLWELEANGAAWCSPRVAELLGYLPEELGSSTNFLRAFLHPDDADVLAKATRSHYQQGQPYDVEIRLQTRSDDYRWYRARATADRDDTGRPFRLSGSLQDVTEARAAREELMRATQAAEAANQAKSEFLANVSHEIRTPMNGIIGMTGLMLGTTLDRTQRDYAETIRASADSLMIVINDILDFSKIEAGRLEVEAIELDLRANVEDVGAMLAFQAAAKSLELVIHVHPDVPSRVIGDPQRVRQCLINLVGNAIKFTRTGEIVIEVGSGGVRNGKLQTRFEVRDTGIGIAPDVLSRLFQPFVQADSSTTRHFGGTGLGLSIVRRLVEMMGGEVGASSDLGRGSTFWFTLPLEAAAGTDAPLPVDLTRLGRRVLVVDDNETNRRVVAGQLMHAGYEVSLAAGGNEALSLLRQAAVDQHPFEVVLVDHRMQDMDGALLGERINGDPQISQARIVMLTSLDRHGDIQRFASLGFAAYLTKPVRAGELFACLDKVLARDSKEWHMQSQPIVTRGTLVNNDNSRRYDCSVLLVEDNAVNQKVAVRFLERMGCRVRVADNGAEGVKAYVESQYDIVLMDLQMPIMDGLTATRRIRELEAGRRHTPIVALTANAMTGQLERCLEAGMNGFLTKPLEIARLHETLDRYGLGARVPEKSAEEAATAPSETLPIALARLNEITEGDPEFAFELASTFIASGEQVMSEVRAALAAFDRPALARAAHKLKGASANVHAEPLREIAFSLESHASSLDQPRLKGLIDELSTEFGRAAEFLRVHAPAPAAKAG